MKQLFIFIFILGCCTEDIFCQENKYTSLQEIIIFHVSETKKNLKDYKRLFITLDFSDSLSLGNDVSYVVASINPEILKKKERYFLIRFIINSNNGAVHIDAVNFRIYKKSNKHLNLINMGNNSRYKIVSKLE